MKGSKYYLLLVRVLLLVLSAVSAGSIVQRVRAWRSAAPPQVELVPEPPRVALSAPQTLEQYRSIPGRDIFNPPRQVQPAAAPPASPLPFKLLGVAVSDHPASSYCVVEDAKSHKQTVYRSGSTIEGSDAQVVSVHWDRVVVLRGGVEEMLYLHTAQDLGKKEAPSFLGTDPLRSAVTAPAVGAGPKSARPRPQPALDASPAPAPRPIKPRRQYRSE